VELQALIWRAASVAAPPVEAGAAPGLLPRSRAGALEAT
jgi:hypothetical protein